MAVQELNNEQTGSNWSASARMFASMLIVLHLIAIVSAPWSFPAPSSQLSREVAGIFQPYQSATFTRHGYRFFAPNPGPGHLIRYEIDMPRGNVISGRFPDRDKMWPRLLYHRFFMISEICYSIEETVQGVPDPKTLTPEEREEFESVRTEIEAAIKFAEIFRSSVARRLIDEHGGDRIRIYLSVHAIPTPDQLQAGKKLADNEFYADLYLIREFSKEEL